MLFTFATTFPHAVFLTTSFFTALLSLTKSLGKGVNLSISSLSTSVLSAKLLTSTCDTFLNQFLLHN